MNHDHDHVAHDGSTREMTPQTQTSTLHPPITLVSHPCRHDNPLTPSEVADIRSLLGAATASTSTTAAVAAATTDAKEHGHEGDATARARRLAGRQVMVPAIFSSSTKLTSSSTATSRAFFEGVLTPTQRLATTTNAAGSMNEIIHVTIGKNSNIDNEPTLVEMTRTEALRYFDAKGNENVGNSTRATTTCSVSSTSLTSEATNCEKIPSNKTATHAAETDDGDAALSASDFINNSHPYPYMEIRETCNNQGQIQHSEVVNMSNVMKRLGERLQDVASFDDKARDGKTDDERKLGTMLAQTLAGVGKDETEVGDTGLKRTDIDDNGDTDDGQEEIFSVLHPEAKKSVIDETKYQELRSRLDELERLEEEEEEENKKTKATLSKKLEFGSGGRNNARTSATTARLGSGWSRGFLNNATTSSKQTKKKERPPLNSARQSAKAKEGVNNSTRVTFSSDENITTEITHIIPSQESSIGSTPSSPNSARVKFSARDDAITTDDDIPDRIVGGCLTSLKMTPSSPNSTKVTFTASDVTISPSSRQMLGAVPSPPMSPSTSRVTFSDDDTITEIPRIGQSKVPPRPISAPRPVYFNNQSMVTSTESMIMEDATPLYSPSIPFEENIFGGIVKERTSMEGGNDETESTPSRDRNGDGGGKKLSRFAQQRLQRG